MIASSLVEPLDQLSRITDRLLSEDLGVNIPSQSEYSPDIRAVFEVFMHLKTALKFRKEVYFIGNEAEVIINFAEAYKLFTYYNNLRGKELCMRNIAELHYKNGRYIEAERALKQSIIHAAQMTEQIDPLFQNLVTTLKERLADVYIESSIAHHHSSKWQKAAKYLEGEEARVKLKRAICYAAMGHIHHAESELAAVRIEPDSPYGELETFALASVLQASGKLYEAAVTYSGVLTENPYYDPWVRKASLLRLNQLFGGPVAKVPEPPHREIVLLIDYSSAVRDKKFSKAIKGFAVLIESFRPTDIVTCLFYNRMTYTLFERYSVHTNKGTLINLLKSWRDPRGTNAFFDAVIAACRCFSTQTETNLFELVEMPPPALNERWLFAFTTGEARSRKLFEHAVNVVHASRCRLIVMGSFELSTVAQPVLDLCESTGGKMLECELVQEIPSRFREAILLLNPPGKQVLF